jgi:CheY-like chemotaxis protein
MSKRILIVDDTLQLLQTIQDVLVDRGYEVEACDLSAEACEMAREMQPDLILLDVNMPGMSGWEVLEVLRLSPETRHIPVVISSADFGALQQRERLLHDKGIAVLYRPFDVDELYAMVERVVGAE